MTTEPSTCAIIACDVFKDELEAFGAGIDWHTIEYLEMGLHDQPNILREEIQKVVNRLEEESSVETILLMYGICGNGLIGIVSKRCQLVLPRAHDCISILLGSPNVHEGVLKENPGTYFYSPGWVRGRRVPGPDRDVHLKTFYSERYPDDEELVEDLIDADHETFEHHNCAAYVEVTRDASAESYCQDCASSLGWKYKKLQGDPSLIKDFLSGNWEESRFLVVQPSCPIDDVLKSPIQGIQG